MASSLISIKDFSQDDFLSLFQKAKQLEDNPQDYVDVCRGKMMSMVFTEPSTRTFSSFSSAMQQLGGGVVGFNGEAGTSLEKGESLEDTALTMSHYGDILVIRQGVPGMMQKITELVDVPVINAGDGHGEHPTQTLLDLYTIHKNFGKLDIKIGFYGDLKYGRTVHSLMTGLSICGAEFTCIAPNNLQMPDEFIDTAKAKNCSVTMVNDINEVVGNLDVLYTSRLRQEYLPTPMTQEEAFAPVNKAMMALMKKDAILMEPLPRVGQILPEVDADPRAKYFEQVKNSIPVRKALILDALGIKI